MANANVRKPCRPLGLLLATPGLAAVYPLATRDAATGQTRDARVIQM